MEILKKKKKKFVSSTLHCIEMLSYRKYRKRSHTYLAGDHSDGRKEKKKIYDIRSKMYCRIEEIL